MVGERRLWNEEEEERWIKLVKFLSSDYLSRERTARRTMHAAKLLASEDYEVEMYLTFLTYINTVYYEMVFLRYHVSVGMTSPPRNIEGFTIRDAVVYSIIYDRVVCGNYIRVRKPIAFRSISYRTRCRKRTKTSFFTRIVLRNL